MAAIEQADETCSGNEGGPRTGIHPCVSEQDKRAAPSQPRKCDVVPFIVHCGSRVPTAARDNDWELRDEEAECCPQGAWPE